MSDFIPHKEFIKRTERASVTAHQTGACRASSAEFERMRRHILELYRDIPVPHSYVAHAGAIFDCVPIDQQPSLRRAEGGFNKTVDPRDIRFSGYRDLLPPSAARPGPGAHPHTAPNPADPFGNRRTCPDGTIPMRRITLEEMTRFPTLEAFLARGKAGADRFYPAFARNHAYIEQDVTNLGAGAWLNVWTPAPVDINQDSISQLWVSDSEDAQSLETGWVVMPTGFAGSENGAFLFIYFHSGDSVGGYNLEVPGFVQVYDFATLGAPFPSYSASGGAQAEYYVGFVFDPSVPGLGAPGWIFYTSNKANTSEVLPLGYYPASLFGTGQLATSATVIEFGGEVAGQVESTKPHLGPMGSGAFAAAGYKQAAYQRQLTYIDTAHRRKLCSPYVPGQDNSCYTVDLHNAPDPHAPGPDFPPYFFFGAPGCDRP
jgi:hypothetical protein